MAIRYSRRAADGTVEYHDSKESVIEAQERESSAAHAAFFGLLGAIAGAVLSYVLLHRYGAELPKLVRCVLFLAGAAGMAWVLARLADIILALIGLAFWGFVLVLLGSLVWQVI
jgi:hypothetical protein